MYPTERRRFEQVLALGPVFLFGLLPFLTFLTFLTGVPATFADPSPRQSKVLASPISAEETLAHFQLHPDCRIELVAAEPDVIDPVAIAFAPDGKLWVVEYSDYPNGPPENGPPMSRIRTLTDADGDGRYTDAVTFADKLLFANGLMLWQDGVIVTTDGAVVFMRDTDGDGRADEQQEWFTGFKRENPQLRANHPTLGLDGHIYIASGLRGGEVIASREDWATDAKPVSLSSRDFRFDPFTGKYESISGVGQFGLCFDPFGNRFTCSNRNPCKHIVLEDRYLARNPHLGVKQVHEDVSPAAENSRLFPISRTWTTSNLHANQFTAACGVTIYGGDALPQFRGNSFTCEPTANLLHRDVLTPKGATFTSTYGRKGIEFLATRDEWFRPVNMAHGPDGALYVVDMYRAVIEHPQFMPTELKTRPDLTLGTDRGRIYRIVHKKPAARRYDSSFRTDPDSLVAHLASPNAWHRETAFRLLLERDTKVDAALKALCNTSMAPETLAVVTALLAINGRLDDECIKTIVSHRDPRVVSLLIQIVEKRVPSEGADTAEGIGRKLMSILDKRISGTDVDPRLKFQAALSIGAFNFPDRSIDSADDAPLFTDPWKDFPLHDIGIRALADCLQQHANDPWFRAAIGSSTAGHEAEVLMLAIDGLSGTVVGKADRPLQPVLETVQQFAQMVGSQGDEAGAALVLVRLSGEPVHSKAIPERWQRIRFAVLASLGDGLRRGKSSLKKVTQRMPAGEESILGIFDEAAQVAVLSNADPALRGAAIDVLEVDQSSRAVDVLAEIVSQESNQTVLTDAISALSRKRNDGIADVLLDGFKSRTPAVRGAILDGMIIRTDRINRLLDEIEAGNLTARDVDVTRANRLTRSRNADIKARAIKLLATADADRAKVITKYTPCLSQPGDPQRGREVFKKTCATCHKVGDIGTNVGADISDSRTKTPEFLLTNILDPNRAIDGNYFGYTILDVEGRVHTGIITSETASSVTLRLPEGKDLTLLRKDIEEMANTGLSLMPVGVEKDISVDQMADLISFIKNWRYLDGSVPQEVIGR